jgi:predicted nucleic acid-binding protein
MRQHVLDANALYRYLTGGKGADIVAGVLKQAATSGTPALMSVVNFGEVYYNLVRLHGLAKTDGLLTELPAKIPLQLRNLDQEDVVRAARLKAQYNLPYADAFAAALTGSQQVLVTADTEHFARVPKLRLLKLPSAKN